MIKYNLLIKKNRLLIEITQMNFIDIISSKNRKKLHTHDYKYKKTKLICGDRSQKMNDSKWSIRKLSALIKRSHILFGVFNYKNYSKLIEPYT